MLLLCLPSYDVHLGLLCFADIPPLVHSHSWWFHTYVLQERSPMPYPYQMERPSANVVHPCPNLRICRIASTLETNPRTLSASTSRHFARTKYKGHLHSPHIPCARHSRQLQTRTMRGNVRWTLQGSLSNSIDTRTHRVCHRIWIREALRNVNAFMIASIWVSHLSLIIACIAPLRFALEHMALSKAHLAYSQPPEDDLQNG
jgi:hypothetical protein